MKSTIVLLSILSFSVVAEENRVLSAKHIQVIQTDSSGKPLSKESFFEELILLNCDVNITSLSANSPRKMRLSFSGRAFVANSISFKESADGSCVVALEKGLGEN